MKHSFIAISFTILAISLLLRVYNLNWGNGHYFHPDEGNIARLSSTLDQQKGLDFWLQGTFSYGSFLIYLTYFIKSLLQNLGICSASYECSSFILRFVSAIASFLVVLVTFNFSKKFIGNLSLLSLVILGFSPGLIQVAHYGTAESVLTLLTVLVFILTIRIYESGRLVDLLICSLLAGIAASIKVNSIIFLTIPLLVFIIHLYKNKSLGTRKKFKKIILGLAILLLSLPIIFLFSPYYLTPQFFSMFQYEQTVVSGSQDIFYTRQFIGTNPFFPITNIYPFLINPFVFSTFILFSIFMVIRNTYIERIILLFFLISFLPNSLFFTKWSRYFIISLPFIALSVGLLSSWLIKKSPKIGYIFTSFLIATSILQGLAFFNIYTQPDVRMKASTWIYDNIPPGASILSESGNVVDLPFQPLNKPPEEYSVANFDFYNLDSDPSQKIELVNKLSASDYILIPSRRIFMNMGDHPEKYPLVSKYYQLLFNGKLGFLEIEEIESYPKLSFPHLEIKFPDEYAEETWTVFDHPVIRIYKRNINHPKQYYEDLFS